MRRRCEDVKIRRCDDRPPLLEEPLAQTLSGKSSSRSGKEEKTKSVVEDQ